MNDIDTNIDKASSKASMRSESIRRRQPPRLSVGVGQELSIAINLQLAALIPSNQ